MDSSHDGPWPQRLPRQHHHNVPSLPGWPTLHWSPRPLLFSHHSPCIWSPQSLFLVTMAPVFGHNGPSSNCGSNSPAVGSILAHLVKSSLTKWIFVHGAFCKELLFFFGQYVFYLSLNFGGIIHELAPNHTILFRDVDCMSRHIALNAEISTNITSNYKILIANNYSLPFLSIFLVMIFSQIATK